MSKKWVLDKSRICHNCGEEFPEGTELWQFLNHVKTCVLKVPAEVVE